MAEHKKLLKSAGIIGIFTLISRILGFLRDIIIAYLFGTKMAAQAFVVAFRIPNTLRNLVGEGATNAAVIPVLSEFAVKKDKKELWELTSLLFVIFSIVLTAIAILGVVLSPFIVRIIAFGFVHDAAKFALTVKLTRIMFSFIVFIGLAAYVMGVLHTLKHFAISAASSCFLNIIMIIFGLTVCRRMDEPILGMAYAVLIGGFFQLAVQIPVLIKKGFRLHLPATLFHPAAKKIGTLLVPRMVGSSIYQLSIFVDTMFASLGYIVGEGAVVALYLGTRLIQFPTGIFGTSMATVCLPTMSHQAAANDFDNLKKTLVFSLRAMMIFLVPSAMGLMVLSAPIINIVFKRGQFDNIAAQMTAEALLFYCVGLFAYSGVKVITTCFYALKDTFTPVKITLVCLLLNIVLNIAFMGPLKAGGLALATSVSSIVNFFILLSCLQKKIGRIRFKRLTRSAVITVSLSVIMGVICWYSYNFFAGFLKDWVGLVMAIALGVIFYMLFGWFLGIFQELHLKYEFERKD
ncbi:MAG: murein biosynthesis integral membrane protein MurJ [Candidatus Omnitrophota bacterium]